MKPIIITLLLIIAISFGIFLHNFPLPLLVTYNDWSIELPLWNAVIILLICSGIVMIVYQVFSTLLALATIGRTQNDALEKNKSWRLLRKATLLLAENQYYKAAKCASKGALVTTNPILHYLIAAQASHQLNDLDKRDYYFEKALANNHKAELGINLLKARLQLSHDNGEASNKAITLLKKISPKHPGLLHVEEILYKKTKDWEKLQQLLPKLKKYSEIDDRSLEQTELITYQGLLQQASDKQDPTALQMQWKKIPKAWKQKKELVLIYTKSLIHLKLFCSAESILSKILLSAYDRDLVKLYGITYSNNLSKQITFIENLLLKYPEDPVILLALSKLCLKDKLWGRARSCLEASIAIKPNIEAYVELATLLDYLGEDKTGREYFKKGLLTVASSHKELLC